VSHCDANPKRFDPTLTIFGIARQLLVALMFVLANRPVALSVVRVGILILPLFMYAA
jgi:hypothetical protein